MNQSEFYRNTPSYPFVLSVGDSDEDLCLLFSVEERTNRRNSSFYSWWITNHPWFNRFNDGYNTLHKFNSLKHLVYISHIFCTSVLIFITVQLPETLELKITTICNHKDLVSQKSGHARQFLSQQKKTLSLVLPQNPTKCNIITGEIFLLCLYYIMWHNQGTGYPSIFTVLAYTQTKGNIQGEYSRVYVIGDYFTILTKAVRN